MKKKKMISLFMAFGMAATLLAGCGSSTDSSGETEETASAAEESSESESAAAEETADAPSCQGALEGVTLVVGTSGTYAPFSYFAEDGVTLQGFDIDFLYALQDILGFEIADDTIQDMDYSPLGTSISQGTLDIAAAALCATDERKESMNFTDIYYDAGIVVVVGVDNETITSVDDLTGGEYTVAIQSGTIAYEYAVANLPEDCLQTYDSQALAYKAVEDGQADATIYDQPGTAYSIKTGEINLKIVGDEFYTGQAPYALALSFDICEEYPEIVDDFNEAIAYLEETGKMDEIKAAWCD
ncbi:MAG: ABC transporter substrate-binding protein [Clostridiales bacterium]|nr:ABC transporter substrate-binding protein [Clostridiales bacterium]